MSSLKDYPTGIDLDDYTNYFVNLDSATQNWLQSLQQLWKIWKKSTAVSHALQEYFATAPNPYTSHLKILVNLADFQNPKTRTSLPFAVVEEFATWIGPKSQIFENCLVPELKIAAYRLLSTHKNIQLLKMVSDIYQLAEHKHFFVQNIEGLLENHKFKEACQIASVLNLQHRFSNPETMLLPLILQNKSTIVEDFLKNYPEAQRRLVTYFDNLLDPNIDMHEVLLAFVKDQNIPEVKISLSDRKTMSKLVARLAKMYNLSPEDCPFLHQKRGEGTMQFLVHKRYVDGTLSTESWREMAKETVSNDPSLHASLVKYVSYHDSVEALYFAKLFDVPRDRWPWSVMQKDDEITNDGLVEEQKQEDWWSDEPTVQYHQLNLPRSAITIVDTVEKFERFLESGLRDVCIVGIDSEWKPSFSIKKPELALIQIATHSHVYILDVTVLGNEAKHLWTELGRCLFNNKHVIKLGFGLSHDLEVIRNTLPQLSSVRVGTDGYLDLSTLWKKLNQEKNFVFPHRGDDRYPSENLSKLAELSLGHGIDKADQFSNWERRPLREKQIIYAALDAYCLLEIYDVLSAQCDKLNVPFHDICIQFHLPYRPEVKALKSVHRVDQCVFESNYYDHKLVTDSSRQCGIPAREFRTVCDSMLSGLGKNLRMCGVDTVLVDGDVGGEKSGEIAERETRVMLTQGFGSLRFKNHLPEGLYYKVCEGTTETQLKEVLCHHGIVVTSRDIFSRCVACNCGEFSYASRQVINWLFQEFVNRRDDFQGPSFDREFELEYYGLENETAKLPDKLTAKKLET